MTRGRIFEQLITEQNHSSGDAISLGEKVLKVTVKCLPDSGTNAFVGWNEPASNKNILEPDESATYHDERVYLDKNNLYVAFDPVATNGRVLVSIISNTEEEVC